MIFAGGLVHLLVVMLPLVCLGESVSEPATLVFLAGATVLYFGDAATMRWAPTPSPSPLDARAHRWAAATGAILLALFWGCLVERAIAEPPASWMQLCGGALLLSGAIFRALAVRTLGRDFRTEIESVTGELVRDGVYRFVRHPSETGLLAASLGAAVLLQSTLGLILWCGALLPVTLARLSLEERALIDRFGPAYQCYTNEVGGLLPLIPPPAVNTCARIMLNTRPSVSPE